jgi:dTDP-glucose 4,6-dehydratase
VSNQTWLVTGGLGFIGSHFIRIALKTRPRVSILNFDAMTYAGNPANVADVARDSRYAFVRGNICDANSVERALCETAIDAVVNFAAESHVDRSILDPEEFLRTDVLGTHVLLEAVRRHQVRRFLQVSTDEVYGHVPSGSSKEADPLAPRSPYAASKAGGDLQVLAHATTYGTPVVISRGSNTYGPNQYPEKLIPLFTTNLLDGEPVPLYGDGQQIRDWIHVEDHARGILHVLENGEDRHVYNIGGGNPRTNLEITERLIELCGRTFETHVRHVVDRPGHDRRYSLDCTKLRTLGWEPQNQFEQGLEGTVTWYREHPDWWRPIKSGGFAEYYRRQYAERGG